MKRNELYSLIASLSKAEKRHFRLTATRLRQNARYLEVFDLVSTGRAQNDDELQKRLKGNPEKSRLHVLKHYLTDSILASLRVLHADASPAAKVRSLLGEAEVMFERELFELCGDRLKKAAALAARHELHALLCEAASWQRALELSHAQGGLSMAVDLEASAISDLETVNRYWKLTAAMNANPGTAIGDVSRALRRRPVAREPYRATVLRHHLASAHHFLQGRFDRAEAALADLIAFMESRPERIAEEPGSYGTVLGNLIALKLQTRQWNGIPGLFARIPKDSEGLSARMSTRRMRLRLYNLELEYLRDRGLAREAKGLMQEIEAYSGRVSIPDDYRILFHYQFACLHYMDGDIKQALRWVNTILANGYGGERVELQAHARLLSLALHYELGNLVLLRYAVDAYRRFLKKSGRLDVPSHHLLRLFAKLSTAPAGARAQLFAKTRAALEKAPEAATLSAWKDYFDWKHWLGARMPA